MVTLQSRRLKEEGIVQKTNAIHTDYHYTKSGNGTLKASQCVIDNILIGEVVNNYN